MQPKYTTVVCALLLAFSTFASPASAAIPAGARVLDEAATAHAVAVRVAPPAPVPRVDDRGVEQMIRDVWPDNLENRAIAIAKRESGPNFLVTAHTYCCFGVFQIHFKYHRSWLDDFGVFVPADLYDPLKNVTAAYHLYELDGWNPWTCC